MSHGLIKNFHLCSAASQCTVNSFYKYEQKNSEKSSQSKLRVSVSKIRKNSDITKLKIQFAQAPAICSPYRTIHRYEFTSQMAYGGLCMRPAKSTKAFIITADCSFSQIKKIGLMFFFSSNWVHSGTLRHLHDLREHPIFGSCFTCVLR